MSVQAKKVLVVDDSKSSRELLDALLERHYLNVDTAYDGVEAPALLEQESDYCLVVTDYNMPNVVGYFR
jgi:CheY-like chemotaxis protein